MIIAELVARTLPHHLDHEHTSHIFLLFTRLQEHEKVMAQMHTTIHALESTVVNQQKEIVTLTAALAASTIALKASETKHHQDLQQEIHKLQKQFTAQTSNASNQVRTELMNEIKKVRQQLAPGK
jgi:hypothetical protein